MTEFNRQFQKFRQAANATPEEIERMSERARHVTETVVLQTYTLQLIGPARHYPDGTLIGAGVTWAALKETEENLSDLLPPNYEVRISEWDAKEEEKRYISDNQKRREAGKRKDESRRRENFKSSPSQPGDYR